VLLAILTAVQDGVALKRLFNSNLERYAFEVARKAARDELTDTPIVVDE